MAETAEEKAKREADEAREGKLMDLISKGVKKAVGEMAEERKKAEPPKRDAENKPALDSLAEFFGIK